MKKLLLLPFLVLSLTCLAQKRDSIKFDTNEVKTLYRNAQIIQQQLHTVHIDGILRDKLDSVYQQSVALFENKLRVKGKKGGK